MTTVKFIGPDRPGNKSEYDIIIIKDSFGTEEGNKLLRDTMQEIGIELDKVYTTQVVKVEIPLGYSPTNEEIESWKPLLFKELTEIKAKVIVLVGQEACSTFGVTGKIHSIRGKHRNWQGKTIFFSFDPRFIHKNPGLTEVFKKDLRTLKGLIK